MVLNPNLGPTPEQLREQQAREQFEREQMEERIRSNDLMQTVWPPEQPASYLHGYDIKMNVETLLKGALGIKFRTWYMPDVWAAALAKSDVIGQSLPKRGEKPEARHIHGMRLQGGQILFFDQDGREIESTRVDISRVFLERDELEYRYGLDEFTIRRRREALRLRRLQRYTSKNLDSLMLAVTGRARGPEALAGGPTEPIDPEQTKAVIDTMDSVEKAATERTEMVETFARTAHERKGVLDDIASLFRKGYDISLSVDPSMATFSDDDWSAKGKWKYVEGRREVEDLLQEPPLRSRAQEVSYSEFLRAHAALLGEVDGAVSNALTGDFETDLKRFQEYVKAYEEADRDPRLRTVARYKFFFDHGKDFKKVLEALEDYEKAQKEGVYAVNPFLEHDWSVDDVRRAVQENLNSNIRFDHIAERLYNDNFKAIVKKLKEEHGVPQVVLEKLKGDDIEDDFMRLRRILFAVEQIRQKVPEERDKLLTKADKDVKAFYDNYDKAKLAYDVLGDYVVYSVRLTRAIARLKYKTPTRLSDAAYARAGGNIYAFNRGKNGALADTPEMARSKALLMAVFFKDVEEPTRYFTLGEKFWKWISGDDPSERVIRMRDFNGRSYSVDRTWFMGFRGRKESMTNYASSDMFYKLVYEAGRQEGTPEAKINEKKIHETLKRYLFRGIAVYRERIDDNFEKMLERNGITPRGRHDEDIQNLHKALEGKLDNFIVRLNDFSQKNPNFGSEEFRDFLKKEQKNNLSEDLLDFLRLGAVISSYIDERKQEKEMRALTLKLSGQDADEIIQKLREEQEDGRPKFTEDELTRIKEGLTTGVAFSENRRGFGAALPLPHGYTIGVGMSTAGPAAGVSKEFELSETVSLVLFAGASFPGGGAMPAGGVLLRKEYKTVTAGAAVGAAAPGTALLGFGVEKRQDVLTRENIDRALLKNHITGPDGLEKYTPEGRYEKVRANPHGYPEFNEVLHALDSLGLKDKDSQVEVFNAFYQIYEIEIRSKAVSESVPIIQGIGLGGALSLNPVDAITFLIPFKFGVMHHTLVFRIADTEGVERYLSESTRQELLRQYKDAASKTGDDKPREIRLKSRLQVDREGRLVLSKIEGGYVQFNPFASDKTFRDAVESKLDIDAGNARPDGLIPLDIRGAYGEIHVNIDPELRDSVLVVTDGDQLYVSIHRDAQVYVTREEITYPFRHEGSSERTYLTISGNPYKERRGAGGIENKSLFYLQRTRETKWRLFENKRYEESVFAEERRVEKDLGYKSGNVLTLADYQKRLTKEPSFGRERLRSDLTEKWDGAMNDLAGALSLGSFEPKSETLPENYETALNALKADTKFLEAFRKNMTKGYDLKGDKPGPQWQQHLPSLYEHVEKGFAANGIPRGSLGPAALERAVTELVINSFMDISGSKDLQKAYHRYLEAFERPLVASIFKKYYQEKGLSGTQLEEKTQAVVTYIMSFLYGINYGETGVTRGRRMEAGTWYAFLAGVRGTTDAVTGIRTLYNPHESSDPYGVIYPPGNEFDPAGKDATRAEIARFWIEHFSPLPEMEKSGWFEDLLAVAPARPGEKPDRPARQKVHEILHTPLCLELALYAGKTMEPQEIHRLAAVYKNETRSIEPGSAEAKTVKKFLEFCHKVREAQLAGKKEIPLDPNDNRWTLVLDQKIVMGIYARCTNLTAASKGSFAIRYRPSERAAARYFVARKDGIVAPEIGTTLLRFGALITPMHTVPFPERTATASATPTPEPTPEPEPGPKPTPEPTPPAEPLRPGDRVVSPPA